MLPSVPWLSLAVWVPIVAGLAVLATGADRNARQARIIALIGAVLGFVVTIPLVAGFDTGTSAMQFAEKAPWIERFNVNYHLGVDGISVLFILLNSFITVLVVIAGWEVIRDKVAQYMAAFLVMSGLLNGVWGGPNRVYAAVKFFLYTLLGSLLMLVAFLYLYNKSGGSFAVLDYHKLPLPFDAQILLFIAFLMAFAVKVPMWPVHTWLPDAHVEAPTGGSAVLAAILLKLGAYGFIRFSLPILPDASHYLAGFMITLSLIAIVYIGLVALVQTDMKKLIAYSSISHMGFVTLGFFIFNAYGMEGGLVQMISHGFVSAALFLCVGVMYDRMHSRNIADYGGVVNTMPRFAALMVFFAMANCGLPATSGFVGEFMVILGAMKTGFWLGFLAGTTLVFGAAYTLWMVKRVVFGEVGNKHVAELSDANARELLVLGLLATAVLWLGLHPAPFTEIMHASVNELLKHLAVSKL